MKVLTAAMVGLALAAPMAAQADETPLEQHLNKQINMACLVKGDVLPVQLERQQDGQLVAIGELADATVVTTRGAIVIMRAEEFLHINGDLMLTTVIDGEPASGACVDLRPYVQEVIRWATDNTEQLEHLGDVKLREQQSTISDLKNQLQSEIAKKNELQEDLLETRSNAGSNENCRETIRLNGAAISALLWTNQYYEAKRSQIDKNIRELRELYGQVRAACL